MRSLGERRLSIRHPNERDDPEGSPLDCRPRHDTPLPDSPRQTLPGLPQQTVPNLAPRHLARPSLAGQTMQCQDTPGLAEPCPALPCLPDLDAP